MSDIPRARELILSVWKHGTLPADERNMLARALRLMHREKYVRRVPGKRQRIDADMRRKIKALNPTNLTQHEIANAVGLRSSGRVSEVLNRKR